MLRLACALCVLWWPCGAGALTLELPAAAKQLADQVSASDSYALPMGPFAGGAVPSQNLEGVVTRQSWQVGSQGLTSLQLYAPLREQLQAQGYDVLFECSGADCGGFDFRFATEVLPAPSMHVDLTDFRFLSARSADSEHLGLLVSRTENAGFVQLIRVARTALEPVALKAEPKPDPVVTLRATELPLIQALETHGHAVLRDLSFETGASALGIGPFTSLQTLAGFLLADPARRVALVGHTDAVGSLENNMALSKRRAASVLERLVEAHGVPRAQLEADGIGYLSPMTTNRTPEGREANRRVEVVLLNTE
ncbi:OmpA family protein [Thalassovita sp.]|uniref:OmpA family protein n=1 Tax=Thalassovita sp. TaxID=1979401 RepID=UPI0029DE8285|nr:OmpA family protein [Thalassovita sp.]